MSIYSEPWYRDHVAKAERGNREHVARYDRSFNGVMAEADAADDIAKADRDRKTGHHSLAAAVVEHTIDRLAQLRERHGFTKSEQELPSMTTSEHLDAIMKRFGPVQFARHICSTEKAPCDEATLVAAFTKAASEQFNMPGDRAFAKLAGADASVLSACAICKAAEFSVFDIKPVVVGTPDEMHAANDDTEQSAALRAYEEILRIAREKFPFLPADQAFVRVFEDKNYAALAAQAHRSPAMTSIYQMPGSTAPGRGAYTKSDPAPSTDTAYAELMHKAEQYRSAHPDLSIAQCFEKIYTARDNIELAKRERIESAPR
jgi:hypothetical protein